MGVSSMWQSCRGCPYKCDVQEHILLLWGAQRMLPLTDCWHSGDHASFTTKVEQQHRGYNSKAGCPVKAQDAKFKMWSCCAQPRSSVDSLRQSPWASQSSCYANRAVKWVHAVADESGELPTCMFMSAAGSLQCRRL